MNRAITEESRDRGSRIPRARSVLNGARAVAAPLAMPPREAPAAPRRLFRSIPPGVVEAAALPFALAAVYLGWGSSCLALRVALEAIPPLRLLGTRYLVAGLILFVVLRARGTAAPTRDEWIASAKAAFVLFGLGNVGTVVVGHAAGSCSIALCGTIIPLVATAAAAGWGRSLRRLESLGLAVGAAGALLLAFRGVDEGPSVALMLTIGPMFWGIGSVWSQRLALPKGTMATAAQLLVGGVMMLALSALRGEPAMPLTLRASLGFLHLTVLGSLVAFTAYGFLLRSSPPAIATSYAYVNPIVALVLGIRYGGEHPGVWAVVSGVVLLAGVLLVTAGQIAEPARASAEALRELSDSIFPPPVSDEGPSGRLPG